MVTDVHTLPLIEIRGAPLDRCRQHGEPPRALAEVR
jgi:hypothetical protein